MKFINLQQRSLEWLAWRSQGITATEIAVVMNKSPYKSPWRLWCEKVGKALPPNLDNNPLVKYGQEHEDQARQLFELTHVKCFYPLVRKLMLIRSSERPLTA